MNGSKNLSFINCFEKWDVSHLSTWIESLRLDEHHEDTIMESIKTGRITGKEFSSWELKELQEHFADTIDEDLLKHLLRITQNVKKRGKRVEEWSNIYRKVMRNSSPSNSASELISASDLLSSKEKFRARYFSFFTRFFRYIELKRAGEEETVLVKERQAMNEWYRVMYGKDCFDRSLSIFRLHEYNIVYKEDEWSFPCSVLISNLYINEKNNDKKKLRHILSPIASIIPKYKKNPQVGMYHTALSVGPWYMEWNNTELVIPKKMFGSTKVLINHDIPYVHSVRSKNVGELIEKIIDVVYKWNTLFSYGKERRETEGNCQHFVDEVLDSLGVLDQQQNILQGGHIGGFLKRMRAKGNSDLVFEPSKELRKAAKLQKKKFTFKTHIELDEYVRKLLENVDLERMFTSEYYILKMFDRAFWSRHFRFPDLEDYKSLRRAKDDDDLFWDDSDDSDVSNDSMFGDSSEGCICPFRDPRWTGAYVV